VTAKPKPAVGERKRGHVVLTLADDERDALDAIATARGQTRSRTVAALALEEQRRAERRRP